MWKARSKVYFYMTLKRGILLAVKGDTHTVTWALSPVYKAATSAESSTKMELKQSFSQQLVFD